MHLRVDALPHLPRLSYCTRRLPVCPVACTWSETTLKAFTVKHLKPLLWESLSVTDVLSRITRLKSFCDVNDLISRLLFCRSHQHHQMSTGDLNFGPLIKLCVCAAIWSFTTSTNSFLHVWTLFDLSFAAAVTFWFFLIDNVSSLFQGPCSCTFAINSYSWWACLWNKLHWFFLLFLQTERSEIVAMY